MEPVILFLASALTVDLIGYLLHRWAHRPSSPLHRPHMTHHVQNYPPRAFFSNRYRTSGSDSLAVWFAPFGALYVALVLLLGAPHPVAILMGGALVAVLSSLVHDLSHVTDSIVWRLPILRTMGRWHRIHHSKMGRNFGILLTVWDRIFRTNHPGSGVRRAPQDRSR
jgi:sterol desaturase/sphingolipid hydroxylase (fatty acid hydroxylase superfamily)